MCGVPRLAERERKDPYRAAMCSAMRQHFGRPLVGEFVNKWTRRSAVMEMLQSDWLFRNFGSYALWHV
jgi:hypothetical protein